MFSGPTDEGRPLTSRVDQWIRVGVVGARDPQRLQGGIETYCRTVYPRMVARGVRIVVFSRSCYAPNDETVEGVEYVRVFALRRRAIEAALHTPLAILRARAKGCNVVHFHAIGPSMYIPLARLLRMKTVVRHLGRCYERKKWGRIARAWLRASERVAARFADTVTFLNHETEREFLGSHGVRCRTVVSENAVPQAIHEPRTVEVRELGLTPGRYLLYVGRLVPEKSVETLILAQRETSLSQQGWKVAIVGSTDFGGAYARKLEGLASIDPNVVLVGAVYGERLRQLYSHAGAFVLPSTHEGMSFSLLEAMSYGLPCVAADIPANRSLDLPDAHYFATGDASALARTIEQVVESWGAAKAARQVERVRERFSLGRLAGQLQAEFTRCSNLDAVQRSESNAVLRTPPRL